MITLTEMLEVNWIILYFVYGQVFFITGLVTGLPGAAAATWSWPAHCPGWPLLVSPTGSTSGAISLSLCRPSISTMRWCA